MTAITQSESACGSGSGSGILYLPSDCRVVLYELISPSIPHGNSKGQTTTPGTSCPTLYNKRVGSFTSPANPNIEDAGDGAYGL